MVGLPVAKPKAFDGPVVEQAKALVEIHTSHKGVP